MVLTIKRLMSYFPTALPVGRTALEKWTDDILGLCGNFANRDSMQASLCQMIIHLPPPKNSKFQTPAGFVPKNHFVQALVKGAANQVASQVYMEIKEAHDNKIKQQAAEAQKAAELAKQAEVTGASEAVTESVKPS